MITNDFAGAAQFIWVLGIEFGLFAVAIALIVYIVVRFRTRAA